MQKRFFIGIKILISIVLVVFLVRAVEWPSVWGYLTHARGSLLLLFIALYLMGIVVSAAKWQFLARTQAFTHTLWFYVKVYLIGTFINNFLPSFVGGDAYRMYALGNGKARLGAASRTVLVDRISGLGGVLFLAALFGSALVLWRDVPDMLTWIVIGVVCATIALAGGIIFFETALLRALRSFLPEKIARYTDAIGLFRTREIIVPTFFYSILFACVGLALTNYVLFLAFGIHIGIFSYLSVIFVISIISSVPVSIGNIGVKEWAYVTLFGLFGVSINAAVTVVLVSRVLQMLVSLVALPLYLAARKK